VDILLRNDRISADYHIDEIVGHQRWSNRQTQKLHAGHVERMSGGVWELIKTPVGGIEDILPADGCNGIKG